jgi:glycosyltransferase involved in cell wall biosynthesis
MFISVIITCYNLEKYIAEAINSVINQNCDREIYEIIVVDDCSTDHSAEIIGSFPSVRYVKTSINQGVLLANVLGMQHANGEVFAFLDGDDVWHMDKLSCVASKFRNESSLIFLTHNYKFINQNGNNIDGLESSQMIYAKKNPIQINQLIIEGILQRKNYVWLGSAYSIRLKKNDILSFINWVKMLPNPSLTYQDWPLAFWIAASCEGRFGYDSDVLFYYRIHSTNFSGDSTSLEKSVKNWSKALYTSLALLDISEIFACNENIKNICRSTVIRDQLILSLFNSPKKFRLILFVKNLHHFGSIQNQLKETLRVLTVKLLGLNFYFHLKKIIGH